MKRLLPFVAFLAFIQADIKAQITFPTNREVYNFSVGDTFIYRETGYSSICSCYPSIDYLIVVITKSHSPNNDTVYYTYRGSIGGYPLENYYTNLDSPVILYPYPNASMGEIDTAFIDSSTYCVAEHIGLQETQGSLSGVIEYKWAGGLGQVVNTIADDGNPENGYSMVLIYYNKSGVSCGNYNPRDVLSGIISIVPKTMLTLYPNPTSDVLRINDMKENNQYSILDATGRTCTSGIYNNEIPVQNFSPGIYFIKTTIEGSIVFKRFIKE